MVQVIWKTGREVATQATKWAKPEQEVVEQELRSTRAPYLKLDGHGVDLKVFSSRESLAVEAKELKKGKKSRKNRDLLQPTKEKGKKDPQRNTFVDKR